MSDSRLDHAIRRADLEHEQAVLLLKLAREAPDGVPMRRTRPSGCDEASLRGFPVVGSRGEKARALAGVGPTDPWKRQRERDYQRRSGSEAKVSLSPQRILAKSDRRCYLCGCSLDELTMQTEHIIALAIGGTHSDANVAAACGPCNSRKGKRVVSFMVASRKPLYT